MKTNLYSTISCVQIGDMLSAGCQKKHRHKYTYYASICTLLYNFFRGRLIKKLIIKICSPNLYARVNKLCRWSITDMK